MLRVLTAGESHGPELVAFMEGLPAGVPVSRAAIQADLARRKLGYGRGSRMKFEEDELTISPASDTASAWAARSRCASATPSGRSGPRS
jgi:chorismate synthase